MRWYPARLASESTILAHARKTGRTTCEVLLGNVIMRCSDHTARQYFTLGAACNDEECKVLDALYAKAALNSTVFTPVKLKL